MMNSVKDKSTTSVTDEPTVYDPERFAGAIDLRLDSNEGPPPSPDLLRQVAEVDGELLRRYPDKRRLEALIASRHGVAPEQVIVTAGADDALDRCCRVGLRNGRSLLTTRPTFAMLPRYAALCGTATRQLPWLDEPFPVTEMVKRIDESVGVVAILSPNNPTGRVVSLADFERVADAASSQLLIVDTVYADFCDVDLTAAALRYENAVVVRSFSKSGGLAGLRVGYAIGSTRVIDSLRAAGGPYPVAALSLALVEAKLRGDDASDANFVDAVCRERELLQQLLKRYGATALPSSANFVFARFANAARLWQQLADRGIGVRRFRDDPLLTDYLRITCPGDERAFARLTTALGSILDAEEPA